MPGILSQFCWDFLHTEMVKFVSNEEEITIIVTKRKLLLKPLWFIPHFLSEGHKIRFKTEKVKSPLKTNPAVRLPRPQVKHFRFRAPLPGKDGGGPDKSRTTERSVFRVRQLFRSGHGGGKPLLELLVPCVELGQPRFGSGTLWRHNSRQSAAVFSLGLLCTRSVLMLAPQRLVSCYSRFRSVRGAFTASPVHERLRYSWLSSDWRACLVYKNSSCLLLRSLVQPQVALWIVQKGKLTDQVTA